jgi:hypothetical protein
VLVVLKATLVFEYFHNLCFVRNVRECDPFVLFVGILFDVILVRCFYLINIRLAQSRNTSESSINQYKSILLLFLLHVSARIEPSSGNNTCTCCLISLANAYMPVLFCHFYLLYKLKIKILLN